MTQSNSLVSKILLTLVAVLLAAGCADEKKSRGTANARGAARTPVGAGGSGGVANPNSALNCTGNKWGVIYADNKPNWDANVANFASAAVDIGQVGRVSPLENQETGISFCARICPQNSEVYIGIWDEFVDQNTPEIGISILDK